MFDLKKDFQSKAKIETRRLPADKLTPIMILDEMNAIALLESAFVKTGKSRYSLLLLKEAFTIYKYNEEYFLKNPNGKKYSIKGSKGGLLSILKEFRHRAPEEKKLYEFPLPLGGIGFLGYEFFNEIEDIEFKHKKDDRDIYESAFIFGRNFLIFDHLYDEVLIASVFYEGEIDKVDLLNELDVIEEKINNIINTDYTKKSNHSITAQVIENPNDEQDYIDKVKYIKEEIIKGNLLQCVPSRRITVETDLSPIEAYRNLRMRNPSPYMFYINFDDFVLFGASPEVMVKVQNNKVSVRPIAGTRKRGSTKKEDHALENELINDEKEKAEHLMLLDLGRNDTGKVSVGGSVKVTDKMIVERYSSVMHLVSEVVGELRFDKNSEDAIKATFPAGTVSGAPKIQAIKTIDKLEEFRRGPYAGLVGYFERSGDFDSCIVIRSCVSKGNKMWIQAGAGIVYDSDPKREFIETQDKAAALMLSLGIRV